MIWWLVIHPDGTGESAATDPDELPEGCAAAFPVTHRAPYGRQWPPQTRHARRGVPTRLPSRPSQPSHTSARTTFTSADRS